VGFDCVLCIGEEKHKICFPGIKLSCQKAYKTESTMGNSFFSCCLDDEEEPATMDGFIPLLATKADTPPASPMKLHEEQMWPRRKQL
jgi:hypothetical protein